MFKNISGAKVRFEIYGKGDKKLLLLHGWGGSVDSFAPLIRDLSDEYTMLVPEMPGHGQSSEPPVPWSVTEYALMTYELIKQTGFEGCYIAAHSFGARIAIYLASEHPECVSRMLLTGAAGLRSEQKPETGRTKIYKTLKKLASLPVIPKGEQDKLRESLIQRFGSSDYKACTPSMRATFNLVILQDLRPRLKDIKCPVFLFWGENDTATPVWMAHVMETEIPDAALQIEKGCGHFAYLERYETFLAISKALFV